MILKMGSMERAREAKPGLGVQENNQLLKRFDFCFMNAHNFFHIFIQISVVDYQSSVKLPKGWLEINESGCDKKFCSLQYQNEPDVNCCYY